MDLIKKKGTLGIRGHIFLCVLIGLLVSEASSLPSDSSEGELISLRLKLKLLMNSYRHLCKQYSEVAANCSAPVFNCTECPDGWLHVEDQCFFLSTERLNWFNSTDKCKELGGHLAILTTREQHDAVEQESRRIGGFYTFFWMGLTDIENEGDWKWVDNSKLKITYWDTLKSQPDNNLSDGQEGEDCAVVDSYNQNWFDVPCHFLYPRICQMDAIPLA